MSSRDDDFWEPIKAVGMLFVVLTQLAANILTIAFSLCNIGLSALKDMLREHEQERKRLERLNQLKPVADNVEHLREKVLALSRAFPHDKEEVSRGILDYADADYGHEGALPAKPILDAFFGLVWDLYNEETFHAVLPQTLSIHRGDIGTARYEDYLSEHKKKVEDPKRTMEVFYQSVAYAFFVFTKHLPAIAFSYRDGVQLPGIGTIPVLDQLIDFPKLLLAIMPPFFIPNAKELKLFQGLWHQLEENDRKAGGALPDPNQFKGSRYAAVEAYLGGTPLRQLFYAQMPFDFSAELSQHAVMVAPTGWGKSQFIQNLVLHLLNDPSPPSIIILNSQGKMLDKIQHLACFAPGEPLADRLVIIDPEDENPPAMNVFALPTDRVNAYSRNIREQVEAGTTETLQYLFASFASELTGKMSAVFGYVIALVLSIRGATFNTLWQVLEDDAKGVSDSQFANDIYKLDEITQNFFRKQYYLPEYKNTRVQVGRRLYQVLKVPAFARMFGSSANKIDFFSLMQKGSVILVNTSKSQLGDAASSLFGRYVVSSVMRAAYERVAIEKPRRTLLIIDEASDYVDQSFEKVLSKVRQFNVGCFMAFQDTSQIPNLNAVMANTWVKLCGGAEYNDTVVMAHNMRSDPAFVGSMIQSKEYTQFATYVRGKTDTAVRLSIPLGSLESAPRMTAPQHAALLERNRERFSIVALPAPTKTDVKEHDEEW